MTDTTPLHLSLPLRFDRYGNSRTNAQDTPAEVATNILVAVSYPRGYLEHDGAFGAKPSPFVQGGTDLEVLAERVLEVEDRAELADIKRVLTGRRERIALNAPPAR